MLLSDRKNPLQMKPLCVHWCKDASTFMSHYALEPWEGLEVAQASKTGYFIKGKAGIK